jgi:CRISPR system Cascade subunit CasE
VTYLTQATIDFATAARLRLHDSYDWHQAVWKAFPGRDRQTRDFLTRLDSHRDGFRLLIVSPAEPVRPDWCPTGADSWRTTPIPDAYFALTQYAFRLCANPTKKVTKISADGSPTKNGRRVPLSTREELAEWLVRKGRQSGFSLEKGGPRCFPRGREYFEKVGQRGLHSAVEFQGMLVVNDPAKFREAFTRGIGPAKAFGFGMLVIVPIP